MYFCYTRDEPSSLHGRDGCSLSSPSESEENLLAKQTGRWKTQDEPDVEQERQRLFFGPKVFKLLWPILNNMLLAKELNNITINGATSNE